MSRISSHSHGSTAALPLSRSSRVYAQDAVVSGSVSEGAPRLPRGKSAPDAFQITNMNSLSPGRVFDEVVLNNRSNCDVFPKTGVAWYILNPRVCRSLPPPSPRTHLLPCSYWTYQTRTYDITVNKWFVRLRALLCSIRSSGDGTSLWCACWCSRPP